MQSQNQAILSHFGYQCARCGLVFPSLLREVRGKDEVVVDLARGRNDGRLPGADIRDVRDSAPAVPGSVIYGTHTR